MTNDIRRRRLLSRGDIPGSNGGIYNPGAFATDNTIQLLCRRELDYRFQRDLAFPELVTLNRRTLELIGYRTLSKVGFAPDTRVEDFRCIYRRGMRLAIHTVVQAGRIRPAISRVFDDALQKHDDLELPLPCTPVEKNWVLFEHRDVLHCLYRLDPLTILAQGHGAAWSVVHREDESGWAARFGQTLSNSANLIPFDDGYLGFWHSIIDGRYVQGALLLGMDLTVRSVTGVLLDGADVRGGFKPGVLYVSALVQDGDRILAFYGEADAHTGVAIFDAAELRQELRRSPFKRLPLIHIHFRGHSLSDVVRAAKTIGALCAGQHPPPLRVHVADGRLRAPLRQLLPPDVSVGDGSGASVWDAQLNGPDGSLIWLRPRG